MYAIAFAADIKDIKPPILRHPASLPKNYFLLFVVAALLLAAILLFMRYLRKRKLKAQTQNSVQIKRPAHEIAYEALQALKLKNLPGQGRIKEYYIELSWIARIYIENRFNIRAPEMTTEEFLFFLRESEVLSGAHKNLLKEFLTLCDIVKFAKYAPLQNQIDDSFDAAKRLVDETKEQNIAVAQA
ncbi:MAG: hypothetical protein V2A72_05545 [Candidatus Omnitrophota bacterium]